MSTRDASVLALLCAVGALGCASSNAPPRETVTRVDVSTVAGTLSVTELHNEPGMAIHAVPAPPDSVLHALARVYAILSIPDAGTVPGQLVYGSRNFRARRIEGQRLSTYIDCGTGMTATPKADEYAVTLTLVSRLEPAEDHGTRVETVMQASARPRSTAGNSVSCQSRGRLEARVAELLGGILGAGR
jgi:hypothetical protein